MRKKRSKFFTFMDLQCRMNVRIKMKLISFLLMFGLMLTFAVPSSLAQQTSVTGKVVDNDGVGIPGVAVVLKGTTAGTITNADGAFELSGVSQNDVLTFTFIGKKPVEMTYTTSTVFNVTLEDETTELEELVVIGYGTIKKSDLTGSVSSVSSEELNSVPVVSVAEGLQGRVAGVAITTNSGAPGGGISVRIRGNTSILNGNEPLYVIDGFPITGESQFNTSQGTGLEGDGSSGGSESNYTVKQNPLAALNPADIESIEVLKDASATAIYGVRGANGVILITTKRGKTGKAQVSFSAYLGTQKVAKKIDMMNSTQYMDIYDYAETNTAGNTGPIFDDYESPFNTDWQDQIFRDNALMSNYQLGISGGSEIMQYNISGNVYNQEGIIKNSGFERYSVRANFDIQASKKFKIGNSLTIAKTLTDAANTEGEANSGITGTALSMSPMLDIYEPDGITYSGNRNMSEIPLAEGNVNPVAILNERSDEAVTTRLLGSLFGEYSFTDDLKLRVSVGADMEQRGRHVFVTDKLNFGNPNNRATVSNVIRNSYLNENTLNYNKTFDKHTIGVLAGITVQKENEEYSRIVGQGFATNATTSYDMGSGTINPIINTDFAEFSIFSVIARANYNYDSRYLVTATVRRDGSSKFAKGEKWATFPSVAVAWRVNNEAFLSNVDLISNLKLRAGYGIVGNQEFDPYSSLALLESANYNFNDGTLVNGYAPSRMLNDDLTWETTSQSNIGLDLSLLDKRINLTADYYNKQTKNLLLAVPLPENAGIPQASVQNIGEMENKGYELAIDGTIISTKDFSWDIGGNIAVNKNEITSLGDENEVGDISFLAPQPTWGGSTVRSYVVKGQPQGVFYGYVYEGIYRDEAEANTTEAQSLQEGVLEGMAHYKDVNEDGQLNADDRTYIGSPHPDFTYGLNSSFKFKSVELRVFFSGQKGGLVYNMLRRFNSDPSRGANLVEERTDTWSTTNRNAAWPIVYTTAPKVGGSASLGDSDFFLEDASYFRMREITLTYHLPQNMFNGLIGGGSIYFTGQNLFTITDYKGYNPDTNGRSGTQNAFGYDASPYPLAKSYIVGLKLNF